MKRMLATLVLPLVVASGSLGLATIVAGPAGAASHTNAMMARTWHGKVTKVNAMMGSEDSFSLMVGMKAYTVDYNAMTKFEMGTSKNIVKGAKVSVTGTLTMTTIKATKISI